MIELINRQLFMQAEATAVNTWSFMESILPNGPNCMRNYMLQQVQMPNKAFIYQATNMFFKPGLMK